jgi:hypothetical protein
MTHELRLMCTAADPAKASADVPLPPPHPAAPGPQIIYTNDTTGTSYLLNTAPHNFSAAQSYCNENGGNLAGFASLAEQLEVEKYYITEGMLYPLFHQVYWMGLRATNWPRWGLVHGRMHTNAVGAVGAAQGMQVVHHSWLSQPGMTSAGRSC